MSKKAHCQSEIATCWYEAYTNERIASEITV